MRYRLGRHRRVGTLNSPFRANKAKGFDPGRFIQTVVPNTATEDYTAKNRFSDFGIPQQLRANIASKGYAIPTPIQDQTIPLLLAGHDVVGMANTGTGKTAAFLIPIINRLLVEKQIRALVIAPTRELAAQIEDEFRALSKNLRLDSVLVIGGVGMQPQIKRLSYKPHLVVGTPGRLKDLATRRNLDFKDYAMIVLDEVDRMLDMGFIRDVRFMIEKLPEKRQSMFFSATIPDSAKELMRIFLKNPITVSVAKQETAAQVVQKTIKAGGKAKIEVLHELLIQEGFDKVLVFGRTKWGMEKLARDLDRRGFKVASIHGNKSQGQRQRALTQFKQNMIQVLLATDIASRGLDIADVTHVINYDLPETREDYIHRIGRTGRADKQGTALTIVD